MFRRLAAFFSLVLGVACSEPVIVNPAPREDQVLTLISLSPGAGCEGSRITIAGRGFSEETAFALGGAPLSDVVIVSPTLATARVPAGLKGNVDLVASNTVGTAVLVKAFALSPEPRLFAVLPSEGAMAGGFSMTVTGECLADVTEVVVGGRKLEQLAATFDEVTGVAPPGIVADLPVDVSAKSPAGTSVLLHAFTYRDTLPCVTKITPAVGCPGDQVVVTGEYFTDETMILVGGAALQDTFGVSTPSGPEIWGVVPTPAGGEGPVEVVSVNPGGRACVKAPLEGLFTYNLDPELTEVAPDFGPMSGGTPVEIRGRCLSNVQSATIGGAELLSRSSPDPKTIRGVLPRRTPASSADVKADVTVRTSRGQDNLPQAFTYKAEIPYVTSFAPMTACEGDVIQVFGGNFDGATTVLMGGKPAPSQLVSAGELLVTVPSGVTGAGGIASDHNKQVDVMVIKPSGFHSLPGFTYDDTPEVKSIFPAVDILPGGQAVTIEGRCFLGAPTTELEARIGSNPLTNMQVLSPKKLTGTVPAGSAPGSTDVTVKSLVLQLEHKLVNGFFYLGAPPTLTSLGADAGCVGDTLTFNGTGFAPSTTVTFSFPDGGVAGAQNVSVSNPTQLTATVPSAAHGTTATVTVTTGIGQASLAGAFTYDLTPKVSSVTPSVGPVAGNTLVSVGGQCFVNVSAARIAGLDLSSRQTVSPTEVRGYTKAVATPGQYDVEVTTPQGTARLDGGFTYTASPPTVTSITPNQACEDRDVIIEGTNFITGTLVTFGANQVPLVNPVMESLTRIRGRIPQLPPGQHTVTATSVNGAGSLNNGFTYDLTPEILSVLPPTGLVGEQTAVTINGRCLRGATGVTFGATPATLQTVTPPNKVQVLSPALTAAGSVDVTVTTPSGTGTASNAFRYLVDRPHVVFNQYAPVIKAADLNNDGHQDLILGEPNFNSNTGRVRVFMGNGNGTFSAGVVFQEQSPAANRYFGNNLVVGHLNSDPYPDLFVGGRTQRSCTGLYYADGLEGAPDVAWVYFSNGTGDFLSPVRLQNPIGNGVTGFGGAAVIGDLDADGDGDLAAAAPFQDVAGYPTGFSRSCTSYINGGFHGLILLHYNTDGSFGSRFVKYVLPPRTDALQRFGQYLGGGRIDGDSAGTVDLAALSEFRLSGYEYTGLHVLRMPARGTQPQSADLGAPLNLETTVSQYRGYYSYATRIMVADFDNDGDDDIALGEYEAANYNRSLIGSRGTVDIYRSNANTGTFTGLLSRITLSGSNGFGFGGLDFGDINGDRFADVYVAARTITITPYLNAGQTYVYPSNGDGTFKPRLHFEDPVNTGAQNRYFGNGPGLIADIDGDGINDLLMGDANQGQFWIFFGPNLVY